MDGVCASVDKLDTFVPFELQMHPARPRVPQGIMNYITHQTKALTVISDILFSLLSSLIQPKPAR